MTRTKVAPSNRKRLFAWVDAQVHQDAKIAATREGVDLQDYVEEAVREKVERDARRRLEVIR